MLRNFDRYSAVLLKPWYTSAEQEWTTGGLGGEGGEGRMHAAAAAAFAARSVSPPDPFCAAHAPLCGAEAATLQDWLLKHVAWMDGELAKEQPPGPPPAGRR